MATGDQADITSRLQQLMPHGWFPNGLSAIRDALLAGIANMLAFIYSMLAYVRLQTRIATATDGFLDLIAADFFGLSFQRKANENDASYSTRIAANIFLERATRRGLVNMLTRLTGRVPLVVEPSRPADTGAYTIASGYGVAGAYGSLVLPYQSFVTAFRPVAISGSLSGVIPYGLVAVSGGYLGAGGYGVGAFEYAPAAGLSLLSDSDIYSAIDAIKVAGTIIWTRLSN